MSLEFVPVAAMTAAIQADMHCRHELNDTLVKGRSYEQVAIKISTSMHSDVRTFVQISVHMYLLWKIDIS